MAFHLTRRRRRIDDRKFLDEIEPDPTEAPVMRAVLSSYEGNAPAIQFAFTKRNLPRRNVVGTVSSKWRGSPAMRRKGRQNAEFACLEGFEPPMW